MRGEILRLNRAVMKREALKESAATLSSPGFEQSHSASRKVGAPFEHYILEACEMQEEIDDLMTECVNAIEEDNKKILTETGGQRQRVLRLKFIANKQVEDIADILNISEKTVKRRLDDSVLEKPWESRFEQFFHETQMLLVDAKIEEHIAWTYGALQELVDTEYEEIEHLIASHKAKAKENRKLYAHRKQAIEKAIDELSETERDVVRSRLVRNGTQKDIAEMTGYSVANAKRIYSRALEKLSHLSSR